MFRRYPVIHAQHISAITEFRIADCKTAVNIFHGANVAASVKLQNHPASHRVLRGQIFHGTGIRLHQLIDIAGRTSPGRFHWTLSEFTCLDWLFQRCLHHIADHLSCQPANGADLLPLFRSLFILFSLFYCLRSDSFSLFLSLLLSAVHLLSLF